MINLADESKAENLETTRALFNGCYVILYTTAVTLDGTQTYGSFVQPTDSGYLARGNVGPAFNPATLNMFTLRAEMTGLAITWTFAHDTGDVTIYGYAVVNPMTLKCEYADDRRSGGMPAPVTITAPGQTYTVLPIYDRDTA